MSTPYPDLVTDPEWANLFVQEATTLEESLEQALSRIPIFDLLTEQEFKQLLRSVHVRRFRPGEIIIRRGVEQSGFYLIRSGGVHIVRHHLDHTETVIDTLGPNELLGEFALVDSTPRTSSLVAAEPSELIGFFKPDLMDILVTNPAMGCKILLRLAEEMTLRLAADYRHLHELGYPFPEDVDAPDELSRGGATLS